MKKRYEASLLHLTIGLGCQVLALANFFNQYLIYAAVLAATGMWFVLLASISYWYARRPEDISEKTRLYLGDATIAITSIVALGIVGFDTQLNAPFLPFYLAMVAYWIYRRHQPGHRAWQVVR